MPSPRLPIATASAAAILVALCLGAPSAHADAPPAHPTGEAASATGGPQTGGTTVVAPAGSGGMTVVVPTAGGGTVTATGCTTVMVNGAPTLVDPNGAPCSNAPYAPYTQYAPPMAYETRPRYQRDSDRTAALIGSAISFGVGAFVTGVTYLVKYDEDQRKCDNHYGSYAGGTYTPIDNSRYCGHPSASASLVAYGAIVAVVPSIPRFVVGDTTGGLIYTGIRGAAVAAAALIPWGGSSDTKWQGPFLLAFAAPITLGIIDLATTPHREDLEDKKPAQPGVSSIAPVSLYDPRTGSNGVLMSMSGIF